MGTTLVLIWELTDYSAAYKEGDGISILGKRILVDVERGRTVRGWKPRRLGGGLGGRPKPVVAVEVVRAPQGFRGERGRGFRGGFERGFRGRGRGFERHGNGHGERERYGRYEVRIK